MMYQTDAVHALTSLPATDLNFTSCLQRATQNQIRLGEPCAHCDVEWCSAICFQRRGYMWDGLHRFVKGDDGKPLRKHLEDRICKEIRFDSER